jgi:hypothetical protein
VISEEEEESGTAEDYSPACTGVQGPRLSIGREFSVRPLTLKLEHFSFLSPLGLLMIQSLALGWAPSRLGTPSHTSHFIKAEHGCEGRDHGV